MDYYDDFNLLSPLNYGRDHIVDGFHRLTDGKQTWGSFSLGLPEICWGVVEAVPVLGHVVGYAEKLAHNWTDEDLCHERRLYVQREIESSGYKIQELYFDTFSSSRLSALRPGNSALRVLDDSTPDLQIASLIRDLKQFLQKEYPIDETERHHLEQSIRELERSQELANLISLIVTGSSPKQKEHFRNLLQDAMKHQIGSLNADEELLIPCGYFNGNVYEVSKTSSGHMATLAVKRRSDGLLNLTLFNTGEGFELHQRSSDRRVYPQFFEGVSLAEEQLTAFLDELTRFACPPSGEGPHKMQDVFDCLKRHCGEPRATAKEDQPYHTQGFVGNCTKKSLQVWLHHKMGAESFAYRAFRHFRLNSDLSTVSAILKNTSTTVEYTHPLRRWGYVSSEKKWLPFVYSALRGGISGQQVHVALAADALQDMQRYGEALIRKRTENLLANQKPEAQVQILGLFLPQIIEQEWLQPDVTLASNASPSSETGQLSRESFSERVQKALTGWILDANATEPKEQLLSLCEGEENRGHLFHLLSDCLDKGIISKDQMLALLALKDGNGRQPLYLYATETPPSVTWAKTHPETFVLLCVVPDRRGLTLLEIPETAALLEPLLDELNDPQLVDLACTPMASGETFLSLKAVQQTFFRKDRGKSFFMYLDEQPKNRFLQNKPDDLATILPALLDDSGSTPLGDSIQVRDWLPCLQKCSHDRLISLLRLKDKEGETPLHTWAASKLVPVLSRCSSEEVLDLLSIQDNKGRTPLHVRFYELSPLLATCSLKDLLSLLSVKNREGNNLWQCSHCRWDLINVLEKRTSSERDQVFSHFRPLKDDTGIDPYPIISAQLNRRSGYELSEET